MYRMHYYFVIFLIYTISFCYKWNGISTLTLYYLCPYDDSTIPIATTVDGVRLVVQVS
jgi:hypothetical protein